VRIETGLGVDFPGPGEWFSSSRKGVLNKTPQLALQEGKLSTN